GLLYAAGTFSTWLVTRDNLVDRQGHSIKYVGLTSEGLVVRDRPGFDPKTGVQLQPINPETTEIVRLWLRNPWIPAMQAAPCEPSFSRFDGSALCWFDQQGQQISFSSLPGYNPDSGHRLLPVTDEILRRWQFEYEHKQAREEVLNSDTFKQVKVI